MGLSLADGTIARPSLPRVSGIPAMAAPLQKEGTLLVASASQDPYGMSKQAAELGLKLMAGETPPETDVLLQTELVTRDNAPGWTAWATK